MKTIQILDNSMFDDNTYLSKNYYVELTPDNEYYDRYEFIHGEFDVISEFLDSDITDQLKIKANGSDGNWQYKKGYYICWD